MRHRGPGYLGVAAAAVIALSVLMLSGGAIDAAAVPSSADAHPAQAPAARVTAGKWRLQAAPKPVGAQSDLNGVSCVSDKFCEAVGGTVSGFSGGMVAERWNGREWLHQKPPGKKTMLAVSCTSSRFCEAIGYWGRDADRKPQNFAERWNGRKWTVQTLPQPKNPVWWANGLSCVSDKFCELVGWGDWGSVAERWNGRKWVLQTLPQQQSDAWFLNGVSCVSATFCEAVGGDSSSVIAEEWNGAAWIQQVPTGDRAGALSGVSCTSDTFCEATGGRNDGSLYVAEQWNGSSWARQTLPQPRRQDGRYLGSLSCVSATFCEAVGGLTGSGGNNIVAEQWNGTAWIRQTIPQAKGYLGDTSGGYLGGVSCTHATFCEAVGWGDHGSIAERWFG